jgi:hypothetical protein
MGWDMGCGELHHPHISDPGIQYKPADLHTRGVLSTRPGKPLLACLAPPSPTANYRDGFASRTRRYGRKIRVSRKRRKWRFGDRRTCPVTDGDKFDVDVRVVHDSLGAVPRRRVMDLNFDYPRGSYTVVRTTLPIKVLLGNSLTRNWTLWPAWVAATKVCGTFI